MQRTIQVPAALVIALQGLVVLFVVASDIFVRRRGRRRVVESGGGDEPVLDAAPQQEASRP
jgi:ABC-type uncharacterized transport system permease subunit